MPRRTTEFPNRDQVAARLIAIRMALDETKASMADLMSCDRGNWLRYEKAERGLSKETGLSREGGLRSVPE